MFRRAFLVVLIAVLLSAGFLLYWTADANRFKPELQALLSEQSGIPVTIEGNLSWRLFPPLVLTAEAVNADNDGQQWSVGKLALDMDVMTILRTRDLEQWRVQALELTDVVMLDEGDRLRVQTLDLRDFRPGTPSPLLASLDYTADYAAAESTPVEVELDALVTYQPQPQAIVFSPAKVSTDAASGDCDLTLRPVVNPGEMPSATDADLVSVAMLRSFDWQGECALAEITVDGQSFSNGNLALENTGAVATSTLTLPEFFGGQAVANVVINASRLPPRWQVTPQLTDVDSQLLMAWLDQRLQWMAALAYGGTIEFTGNTREELLASMSGNTTFDAGQGSISITKIKAPLLKIATLLKEPERVSAWPDLWDYQRLTGDWRIQGAQHALDFALDNLTVTAHGSYDVLDDQLDMLAELQFTTLAEGQMFDVNPLLMDLPIPVRCVGSADAPTCRLVGDAAQRIVATALTSDEDSALRAKIDEKIEEKVPEEYRDAARGLLDLLGGALEKSTEEQ